MLAHADSIAALSQAIAAQFDTFRSEVDRECTAGNLDSCFAASELRPAPGFRNWSATTGPDTRKVRDKATSLIDLCKRHQPSACHRLGMLVFVNEGANDIYSLSSHGGLRQTLAEVLAADGVPTNRCNEVAEEVVGWLREGDRPPLNVMRTWARSCASKKTHGCLLGATFQWHAAGQDNLSRFGAFEVLAERTLGRTFERYCPKYPSICARGKWHTLGFNDGPPSKGYRPALRRLCAAGDADGCFREGVSLSHESRSAEREQYERACSLGSLEGCGSSVDHAIRAGDAERALGFALAACQSVDPGGCDELVEKFGRSRDFTSRATGRRLMNRACEKGHQPACYTAAQYAFQDGETQAARKVFGILCESKENLRACRAVAQIAWTLGEYDSAKATLAQGCATPDINSCVELAMFQAARGERGAALRELDSWLEKSPLSTSHLRTLRKRIETGFRPKKLAEIFQDPIDGSQYFLTADPGND